MNVDDVLSFEDDSITLKSLDNYGGIVISKLNNKYMKIESIRYGEDVCCAIKNVDIVTSPIIVGIISGKLRLTIITLKYTYELTISDISEDKKVSRFSSDLASKLLELLHVLAEEVHSEIS